MPNPKNIEKHKFKKGQSGNPKGRPKLPDIKDLMAEVLGEEKNGKNAAQAIVAKWREMASKGNLKAGELLMAYGYGKPQTKIDLTTEGEKLSFVVKRMDGDRSTDK